jgi:hypothetical protein
MWVAQVKRDGDQLLEEAGWRLSIVVQRAREVQLPWLILLLDFNMSLSPPYIDSIEPSHILQ